MDSRPLLDRAGCWPALPLASWQDTGATLGQWDRDALERPAQVTLHKTA